MYKITLINDDKEILLHHFSNDPEAPKILSAKGKFGFNGVPSVTIEVPVTNKAFNEFYELVSHIKIEDHNGIEIFYGRMINPSDSFNNGLSKILIFEGELAYLNDTTIRPREWHDYSVKDFLKEILDEHNSQVEDYKKIYLGNVTVTANLYRTADYENTLTLLLDRLPNRLGGFFVLRKIDGKKYLDYLLNVGKVSNQEIVFGENMLDYQTECDTTGIYTKLIPLGASKTDGSEESKVGNRLTINEVNDDKDYLINEDAAKVYGLIETTETWNDVTIASNLKRKGEEYLKEISKPRRSLKMKIADMHEIDIKYDKFSLGDEVPIKCKIFNVDERFRIIEIAIDFLNPLNTTYTFGNKFGTLTDNQLIIKNTQAKLDSFFNENGLLSSYLEGTINLLNNNMRAMVDSADKHNGTAILFECKVPGDLYGAMAIGTKGFMIADELNSDGTWRWRTFGTAKGFVADMIIAGSMIADRIKSGILMSMNEKTWINMDDGTFSFGDLLKFDGTEMKMKESAFKIVDSNDVTIAYIGQDNWMRLQGLEVFGLGECMQNRGPGTRSLKLITTDGGATHIDFNGNATDNYTVRLIREAGSEYLKMLTKGLTVQSFTANTACGLEVRSNGSSAYLDFAYNSVDDYNARLILNNNDRNLHCYGDGLTVHGNLQVTGNKNCVQNTENYGQVAFYATEDCESYFTDRSMELFTVEKTAQGAFERIILIDTIFKEAVNLEEFNYTVEIIKQGWGDYRIKEQTSDYFIVESDREDFTFKYIVTARRKGYENVRLEEYFYNGESEVSDEYENN